MSKTLPKEPMDGASLSPKLKPKAGVEMTLPIGKLTATEAGAKVARHYKHAAAKSGTYSPQVVDMIYHMSRHGRIDGSDLAQFVCAKLEGERKYTQPTPPPTLDQLVFVSANLTRLVIDPYREKCNAKVTLGPDRPRPLALDWPLVFSGVDFGQLPPAISQAIAQTAGAKKLAYSSCPDCAQKDSPHRDRQIACVDITEEVGDLAGVGAVELSAPTATQLQSNRVAAVLKTVRKQTDNQIPVGITVPAHNAAAVVDKTCELEPDFYFADAQWINDARPASAFPELLNGPRINVLADIVERLRHHRREELIQIIYHGGIRDGADAGKVICLGASAAALGLSAVLGMGVRITSVDDEVKLIEQLSKLLDITDAVDHLGKYAASVNSEVTVMARACGKSSVRNMEPEDLRAISVAMSQATGVVMAGKEYNFRQSEG
jgi:hypothetical protein